MNYGQAQAQGIPYKAWRYMCEQEDIQREEDEQCWPTCGEAGEDAFHAEQTGVTCEDDIEERSFGEDFGHGSREIFPGEDPDSICMCPACVGMRAKFEHDVALARAVLHCPETPEQEESHLVSDALNTPIARFIQGQLAMERWAS